MLALRAQPRGSVPRAFTNETFMWSCTGKVSISEACHRQHGPLGEFQAREKPCLKRVCQLGKAPEAVLHHALLCIHTYSCIHMTIHYIHVKNPCGAEQWPI